MTYREAVEFGTKCLTDAGVPDAALDAWYLLQMVCRIERSYYYVHGEEDITQDAQKEYEIAVQKRAEHIPLQYIIGEQEFMGLRFKVNSNVLIPRQDTETLVEQVLKIVKPGMKVLDLCTGSGCVLISVLKNAPELTGVGSDISKTALLVAKENAKMHEVDADWIRSDLFDNITETFDVIMANPPYIPTGEILSLMPEVRDFEPENALDGGADGLDFYRKIAGQVKDYLNPGGYVYMEIGYDQGEAVSELMRNAGFTEVEVIKDLARNDRVVKGKGN
ncbi:peptide chain release factor N(5)-glutamine methyltransferase [Roseburia sp. AF15-21]|jgi:release factor glutamine methyltransferase|uniref:peptide chain release factor N(5)-glutamine methyltransferase n=1 Tax=unclassified Roseburia TaxID=2637578 RepID=UPI000E4332F0|nr:MULTISPECIES: peptide chain release factor N(5)-glutamine methyltransferase [unclassified Roseburia]RGF41024.1 peptide chain release factor N(5)-glutamine methyltransferase [Roseburia sp. AF42-8]RGG40480.1 peptide chain release factor N(5)-glutamine methyltransferase [Roseburia sp. AF22-8AC]RGG43777.1 peptide chain release factor N(5)-glutamine methyltransferase [Roseburia sp. AF22-2LB]RHR89660.1 peptide chain release factor N(5)-glutamine methyltransferase [Roseburia sp. AF15-21]RHS21625.1